MNFKYYRIDKMTGEKEEISRDKASYILSGAYKNVNELLKIPQQIPTMTCIIEVSEK